MLENQMYLLETGIILAMAYLIGSIPTGFVIARLAGIPDIRAQGSGNIGATNVARILGRSFFPLVFLIDAGKSYAFITYTHMFDLSLSTKCLAAASMLCGNLYSCFLGGSGGKGVATGVGILGVLMPETLIPLTACFCVTLYGTRTVGVASVIAAALLPIVLWLFHVTSVIQLLGIGIALAIIWRHRDNITRYYTLLVTQ